MQTEKPMMTQMADLTIRMAQLVLKFGRVNRATFHEDGERPETDTDHTVMLAIIACELCPLSLQRGKVAQFVLVHDLIEAKVGDENTFGISDGARAKKKEREEIALQELYTEFSDTSWMVDYIQTYEDQEIPEARFVRYLDKAMPKITHILNHGVSVRKMGKNREDMIDAHRIQFDRLSVQYPEFDDTPVQGLMRLLMKMSEDALSYRS